MKLNFAAVILGCQDSADGCRAESMQSAVRLQAAERASRTHNSTISSRRHTEFPEPKSSSMFYFCLEDGDVLQAFARRPQTFLHIKFALDFQTLLGVTVLGLASHVQVFLGQSTTLVDDAFFHMAYFDNGRRSRAETK